MLKREMNADYDAGCGRLWAGKSTSGEGASGCRLRKLHQPRVMQAQGLSDQPYHEGYPGKALLRRLRIR